MATNSYSAIASSSRAAGRLRKRVKAKSLVKRPSTNAHLYIEGGGNINPTNADTDHVNENAPEPEGGNGEWVFERMILQNQGMGNYSRVVHLYALADDDGNLVERLVVKIQGHQHQKLAEDNTRLEFGLHQRLTQLDCPHILRCYGSSIRLRSRPPQLGYGYMEYALWGDLWSFTEEQRHTPQVPEPFIWFVFRGLAEAVYTLSTGLVISPNEPLTENTQKTNEKLDKADGWETIVNGDIKPANVVLADNPRDMSYKVPKMIDFGFTLPASKWPPAERRMNLGTRGYLPPEQQILDPSQTRVKDWARFADISIHSMIFNIGLVILALMENGEVLYDVAGRVPSHTRNYTGTYSHDLEELAIKCVKLCPWDRIKLWRLLYLTKRGLERWEDVYGDVRGKREDELLPFARAVFQTRDTVGVGGFMGDEWSVKKRKAKEDAVAGPSTVRKRALQVTEEEEEVVAAPSKGKQREVTLHAAEEEEEEEEESEEDGEEEDEFSDYRRRERRLTSQDAPGESEEELSTTSRGDATASSGNDVRSFDAHSQDSKRPRKRASKASKMLPKTSKSASKGIEGPPAARRSERLRAQKKPLPAYKIGANGRPRLL